MKKVAKVSGLSYLIIFISGFYANFIVLENLANFTNPSIVATNLANNHLEFGSGLLGFSIMLLFDLLLVWLLFILTKSTNKNISIIASFFRLLHTLFFGVALFKLFQVYKITYSTPILLEFENKVIKKLLVDFDFIWTIGLLFFGVHLMYMCCLVFKSSFIPKILALLLLLAGIGYLIDGTAKLFITNYIDYKSVFEIIVILPSIIGELSFTIWLLLFGFNVIDRTTIKNPQLIKTLQH